MNTNANANKNTNTNIDVGNGGDVEHIRRRQPIYVFHLDIVDQVNEGHTIGTSFMN